MISADMSPAEVAQVWDSATTEQREAHRAELAGWIATEQARAQAQQAREDAAARARHRANLSGQQGGVHARLAGSPPPPLVLAPPGCTRERAGQLAAARACRGCGAVPAVVDAGQRWGIAPIEHRPGCPRRP